MQATKPTMLLIAVLASLSGFLTIVTPALAAAKEKILCSFDGNDGASPYAVSLVFDASGNLYGTTSGGGTGGGGTVFRLVPSGNGGWSETVLRNFSYTQGNGGALPAAGVILDSSGNLYGTASNNGATGHGTVFELTPGIDGNWTEEVLTDFGDGRHGAGPFAGLTFDTAGNLYGTGAFDGAYGYGTVFQLTHGSDGKWTLKTLHNFHGWDGSSPFAGVIVDASGNLYGTTTAGGANQGCEFNEGCGTIFQLVPSQNGKWTEKVLHSFGKGNDGQTPDAGLNFDGSGNLYGTAYYGGAHGSGIVFELMPGVKGRWTEKILHNFCAASGCPDGANPYVGLVFDAAGNLYGTTVQGGTNAGGVAFKLMPGADGKWKEEVLHSFGASGDGTYPVGGLTFDAAGNLYGTTEEGGVADSGVVFEITP